MAKKPTILVVDDELTVRRVVKQYLEKEGYQVLEAENGTVALQFLQENLPDLMILDIMLPGLDGFAMTRSLRNPLDKDNPLAHIPIIMLTARTEERDRITGFELGADDYVTKPFSPRELVMRVKALLRRSQAQDAKNLEKNEILSFEGLRLDPFARTVERDGQSILLTSTEFDLLYFLAQNPGHVFTRLQLLDKVWGYDFYGDDSNVTVHVHRVREKVEMDPTQPKYIHTLWGVGYKFEVLP